MSKNNGATAIIAVMGVTGAGKSSFIKTITQREDVIVGAGLKSQTSQTTPYEFDYEGTKYILVDTPGFNDTTRPDHEILEDVVSWLSANYKQAKQRQLLSGIIYLHPITSPRVQNSTMTQIRVFKELCGEGFYDKVTLGTTFWEKVDLEIGKAREEELYSTASFLGDMKDFGASTVRIYQDRDSCLKLITRYSNKAGSEMKVQKEMNEAGATFECLSATTALSPELAKLQLDKIEKEKEIRDQAAEKERKNKAQLKQEEDRQLAQLRKKERDADRNRARIRQQEKEADERRQERIEEERRIERQRIRDLDITKENKRTEEAAARAKKLRLEEEKKATELAAKKRREEEESRERARQAEQRAQRLINHSRSSMLRRGDGLFDSRKQCNQPVHGNNSLYYQQSMKCFKCSVTACFGCFNSGRRIIHYEGCDHRELP